MYIALRLLRDGAHLTITTRFPPNDAIRRFKAMEDSNDWIHRLRIVASTSATPPPRLLHSRIPLPHRVHSTSSSTTPHKLFDAPPVPTALWSTPSPVRFPPVNCLMS